MLKNSSPNLTKEIISKFLIGAAIGYFILHPFSDFIDYMYANEGSLKEVIIESFRPRHFGRASYFVFLGALMGILAGLNSYRNKVLSEKLRELSIKDDLTGLINKTNFIKFVEREIERSKRYKRTFSLAVIDIDKFKSFNDRYGHSRGDEVISFLAQSLKESIRETDIIGRYGGDEFVVLMPETESKEAFELCSRLQAINRNTQISRQIKPEDITTLSIGISSYPMQGDEFIKLFNAADNSLYKAKREGGDKIIGPD